MNKTVRASAKSHYAILVLLKLTCFTQQERSTKLPLCIKNDLLFENRRQRYINNSKTSSIIVFFLIVREITAKMKRVELEIQAGLNEKIQAPAGA